MSEKKKGQWKRLSFHGVLYVGCSLCGAPIPKNNQFTQLLPPQVLYCIECGAEMGTE